MFLMTFSYLKSQSLNVIKVVLDTTYDGAIYTIKDVKGNIVENNVVFDNRVFTKIQLTEEINFFNENIKNNEKEIEFLKGELKKEIATKEKCSYFLNKLK